MKSSLAISTLLFLALALPIHTQAETTNAIPAQLRQVKIVCDKATIQTAVELHSSGWTYIMPTPKSPQAMWGNRDGRTTWFVGYWKNSKNGSTSSSQPKKNEKGELTGDGAGTPGWRRGGSPPNPTKIEWLCSKSGGPSTQ